MTSISTFPRFSQLPGELRIQIWQEALHAATDNRLIPVAINHHPAKINHSCLSLGESFCGHHDHCPSYIPNSDQPSSNLACMFNGYFSLKSNDSDIKIENEALRSLKLVCTESHAIFLSEFPDTITVFDRMFIPGGPKPRRQQLRCNPARDILQVTEARNYWSKQNHPCSYHEDPLDIYHDAIETWFPQNRLVFANFRYLVSKFRRVRFDFWTGFETPSLGSRLKFSEDQVEDLFLRFSVSFEKLECLYLWYQRETGTAVSEWRRVDSVQDLRGGDLDSMVAQRFSEASDGILNCDHRCMEYLHDQTDHKGECCWVPTPKVSGWNWDFRCKEISDLNLFEWD